MVSPLLNSFMPIIRNLEFNNIPKSMTSLVGFIVLLTVSPSEFKVVMGLIN